MNYLNMSESAQRRDERDRQLTELYCEIYDQLKSRRVKNLRRVALSIALGTGSPRYHVGFDRAYAVVPQLLNDSAAVLFKSSVTRDMWLDITAKVRCMMTEGKMSMAQAITIVLEQCRAPRFFLTPEHAWVIIKRTLSRMNCRRPYGRAA
ncbi:MAG: hypothetical protein II691_01745 [Muribaculaceae bacterium]|nr:hypothetical protein [Muribaculaceae bacterium]MBQ3910016.1 hypothetical protein [Muribaculaceae bacterium]